MILVLVLVGGADVSPPNNSPMSGAAARLLLRPPFLVLGAGAVITGIAGSVSFRDCPLLLDLGFDDDVARSVAGGIGVSGARWARSVFLLLDLVIDADASRAAAADDAAAGGPGGSAFLLLDLAGFADAERFASN